MRKRQACSRCAAIREVDIVVRDEHATIKGKDIAFKAMLSRCTECGYEFEAPGQLDENLDAALESYARLYDTPSSDALIALRARYGASQKAFSAILGFGELTMNRYEKGGSPDPSNRLLLRLAEDPYIFKAMYDINAAKIGAIQRRRIETSDGFQTALRWCGLFALSSTLTPLQREKIEACATLNETTVSEQIAAYVGAASFQDYSRLYAEARWPDEQTKVLSPSLSPTVPTQGAA